MPIRVKCESCKKTLSVKDHLAGKKIKCPVCQNPVVVPAAATPSSSGPAAPTNLPPNAPAPGTTKSTATTKTATTTKATPDKAKTNGATPDKAKTNGATPVKPKSPVPPKAKAPTNGAANGSNGAKGNGAAKSPPAPVELPPENVEDEAAAAFRDEPKPEVKDETPQTIDFTCEWCETELKLPLELGGKQSQCPNPECRRIIKVPMPKPVEKKDWRKKVVIGPSGALSSQPEQLEGAWGNQEVARARASSLEQAGAIERPKMPGIGVFGWMRRGFYGVCILAILGVAGLGISKVVTTRRDHFSIEDVKALVKRDDPKIRNRLLAAEAHRTLGLLYLQSGEKDLTYNAKQNMQGAASLIGLSMLNTDADKAVNEQMLLIDIAIVQIELGGNDKEYIEGKKIEWEKARAEIASTLEKIPSSEVQALALREIATRLIERNQPELALGLTSKLSNPDEKGRRPVAYRQQIALRFAQGEAETVKKEPKVDAKSLSDGHVRVGYAEGYARKKEFEKAEELAKFPGPARDRLDANLGIAAIALQNNDTKDKAGKFVKEALNILKEKDANPTPWQLLQLIRIGSRTDEADAVKDLGEKQRHAFKLRIQYELFLAQLDKAAGPVDVELLREIELADKDEKTPPAADATTGTTLALAWSALAQHNARKGASRADNRKLFESRMNIAPHPLADMLRPMVDIGSYLGNMKIQKQNP